jgi:hypothetical protein
VADSAKAVPYLAKQVRPAEGPAAARLARLIADLDAENFDDRDRATRELAALGDAAEPALRKALEGKPSAEVRQRVEGLLAKLRAGTGPEALRRGRAVEVLERAGTPEARRALEVLAKGLPGARLTREAAAALARLASPSRGA